MRGPLVAVVVFWGAFTPVLALDFSGVGKMVDALPSEQDECGLLVSLCRAAGASLDRADSTPPSADVLGTRQALSAERRVEEANLAADAIERKRGHRLKCFDNEDCAGILRRPAPPRPK